MTRDEERRDPARFRPGNMSTSASGLPLLLYLLGALLGLGIMVALIVFVIVLAIVLNNKKKR
ncbi:MAG: hypothetical protein IKX85_01855 [Clostridia bacterium]|nr:hypothetical protein [Clostridia bacterium]